MKKKIIITSIKQKPMPHFFYGDYTERSLDPWHEDAFPERFKHLAPSKGKRKSGWLLLDNWGNQIDFVPDGTEIRREKGKK